MTEASLIIGIVFVSLGALAAIYGTILCYTVKVCKNPDYY